MQSRKYIYHKDYHKDYYKDYHNPRNKYFTSKVNAINATVTKVPSFSNNNNLEN